MTVRIERVVRTTLRNHESESDRGDDSYNDNGQYG